MPQLKFYVTQTNLKLEKMGKVLGGYTMVENCPQHKAHNTEANPRLQFIQELIIDCKQFPAALLRPWGYTSTHESRLGVYPRRTIFFYKHHVADFDDMRDDFNNAPEGFHFEWKCGCVVRKYTAQELIELCSDPWYPWFGEREAALFNYGEVWKPRRRTGTAQEIADALLDAGVINDEQAQRVVEVIRSHRNG